MHFHLTRATVIRVCPVWAFFPNSFSASESIEHLIDSTPVVGGHLKVQMCPLDSCCHIQLTSRDAGLKDEGVPAGAGGCVSGKSSCTSYHPETLFVYIG